MGTTPDTLCHKIVSLPVSEMRDGYTIKIFPTLAIRLNLFVHSRERTIGPEFYNLAWLGGAEGPLISLPSR